ncbi:MAG TPA: CCA tRNA nucleotidyltransferase [Longimicrobiales bacterium]|nr:CCA tRNA nucleotidyltransferase [Longimicrobiales bacterium]
MRLTLQPPAAVREITERLERHGFETWAVGGAVRDALIGPAAPASTDPNDWDLATRARPADVRRIFRRTAPIGIEHGTVGVLARDGVLYEVTTFRRDIETDGRHAVVAFADTIDEDLARRDFTFNAIAWHPLREEVHDPFGGLDDLRRGVLRTVGEPAERFAEDYLRVLRALRFAGHFVMQIFAPTWEALCAAVPHLSQLSAERVREELWKIFSKTRHASAALKLYADSKALAVLYPELTALSGLRFSDDDSLDAWQETLMVVDAIPATRPWLRMTALLHLIGTPPARTRDLRGGWRFTGHEQIGARKAADVLHRLKASNSDTERVVTLVARQNDLFPPDAPNAGIRRWLLHVEPGLVNDFFRLRIARWRARPVAGGAQDLVHRWRRVHSVLLNHPVLSTAGLAINGADLKRLGLTPGPRFGEILRALLDRVIEQPELNTKENLLTIVQDELAAQ